MTPHITTIDEILKVIDKDGWVLVPAEEVNILDYVKDVGYIEKSTTDAPMVMFRAVGDTRDFIFAHGHLVKVWTGKETP